MSDRRSDGRKRTRSAPVDVERRLFEISLGNIRLLDTTLEKAGLPDLATLLRELVMSWRAYPSRSVFSREDLRGFLKILDQIMAGLRAGGRLADAEFIREVVREIRSWNRASN
jgi:hypothetical protein